jgi:methylmalonyl-CoA mutase C-terminal domain/subunit
MDKPKTKVRILLAKPGLDGHDRGIKTIAQGLKKAGFEVIYTGLHQTIPQIVSTAIQEDVDVVGVSILSGAHMTLIPELLNALKQNDSSDKIVVAGGFIPEEEERKQLEQMGVKKVFEQDTPIQNICRSIQELVKQNRP